jgi:hypothetical protein
LLSDALNFAISMSLNFKDEIDSTTFDNLMKEYANVVFELSHMAFNIKHEIVRVLDFFLSFFTKYEEKNHNMFFKMLDPRFKTYHLVSSLIGHNKVRPLLKNITKFVSLCF